MQSARVDNALARRQAQRALELLEAALNVLCEQPAENDNQVAPLAAHVYRARAALADSSHPDEMRFGAAVVSCNQLLDDALQLASQHGPLSSRHAQSMEAVARTQVLLYPIARIAGYRAAKPPPTSARPSPPKAQANADRRASHRVAIEAQVTYVSESNFYAGFAEDLSDGGLFIATYNLQPIGTRIEISFTLPNGHIVKAAGQVRWVRDTRDDNDDAPPGMGVQFEALAPEDKRGIVAFLRHRDPLFYAE